MEVIKSQKNKNLITYNGYTYRRNRCTGTRAFWRCVRSDCKGTASTAADYENNRTVRELQEHNHTPDPAYVGTMKALGTMLSQAETTTAPPRRVIAEGLAGVPDESLVRLPNKLALSQRIRRKRRREEVDMPREPATVEQLFITDEQQCIRRGDEDIQFLQHDENTADGRIIVFASRAMLDQIEYATELMADGTFKVCPSLFAQLYVVHAIRGDFVFPCIYALLPGKSRSVYESLWRIIQGKCPQLRLNRLVMDFEKAAATAVTNVFVDCTIDYCFFHLSQAVWRKIQQLGLSTLYVEDEQARQYCKMLCSLAFLPYQQVCEAYEELEERLETMGFAERLHPLYTYFEDTYVGRPRRRQGRRQPLFPIRSWNVRERTERGIPRTTNRLEGWHNAFSCMFTSRHPSIWRFIDGLKKEESLQYCQLQRFQTGNPPPPPAKRYKDNNSRLSTLTVRFNEGDINRLDFLRGVSYNFDLNI